MIQIKNIQTIDGKRKNLLLEGKSQITIDADKYLLLPGLIDPHVHFRTPGLEQKEDWRSGAKASIAGGYTTVFDMPNTQPPTVTASLLEEKKQIIDQQLAEVDIPLHYELFFGADKNHFDEIAKVKKAVVGIKVFMGHSTGNLVIDDDSSLHAIFSLAHAHNMLVAVHAEDEQLIKQRQKSYSDQATYRDHSEIRNSTVAAEAVSKAIALARLYKVHLYILHVSSKAEVELIKQAKHDKVTVYAETTPHHLFLSTDDYENLKGYGLMNPPLRSRDDQQALFEAIDQGIIDTIGSDHAPHTTDEKQRPYGQCPCGVPGIETTLPLLLNAYHEGLLTLEKIVALTSTRAQQIFNLPVREDFVLVDLAREKLVVNSELNTKCGWSPFHGKKLKGWPVYTILSGRVYEF